jgi:hypothetical protein
VSNLNAITTTLIPLVAVDLVCFLTPSIIARISRASVPSTTSQYIVPPLAHTHGSCFLGYVSTRIVFLAYLDWRFIFGFRRMSSNISTTSRKDPLLVHLAWNASAVPSFLTCDTAKHESHQKKYHARVCSLFVSQRRLNGWTTHTHFAYEWTVIEEVFVFILSAKLLLLRLESSRAFLALYDMMLAFGISGTLMNLLVSHFMI